MTILGKFDNLPPPPIDSTEESCPSHGLGDRERG